MTDQDKIRTLEARIDRLEHVLLYGAPMAIDDQVLCEAIVRGDRKTVALWATQQKVVGGDDQGNRRENFSGLGSQVGNVSRQTCSVHSKRRTP